MITKILIIAAILVAPVHASSLNHAAVPPHSWTSRATTPSGLSCCGPKDLFQIPHRLAINLSIGDTVGIQLPSGVVLIRVSVIYPSRDENAYITALGCVFRGPYT